MKICLLSGALKNAGDFLIVKRSEDLLKSIYPNCEIIKILRNVDLTEKLEEINSCDVIVFAGGPAYHKQLYPKIMPLTPNLKDIKPKMFFLGMGWFGRDKNNSEVYSYEYTLKSKELLTRVSQNTKLLGCRDWYAVRSLIHNGYENAIMTGCPAWYNLEFVDIKTLRKKPEGTYKKICISDPADKYLYGEQSVSLVKYLQSTFPNAIIKYVFHRGIERDRYTGRTASESSQYLKSRIEGLGVECSNIAYGWEGFGVYDDCDLHIGHRVHAHIYNLSIRNQSVLLEEDARGAGVNEAIGLWSIPAYEKKMLSNRGVPLRIYNKLCGYEKANKYTIETVDEYLKSLIYNDYSIFDNAFLGMNHYYKQMVKHIESIESFVEK